MLELLKFQKMNDNAKLKETLKEFGLITGIENPVGLTFSIPSGHTCGGLAKTCLTLANKTTGKLTRGKFAEFYCFSALNETRPIVRAARWHNYELLLKLWSYAGTDYVDIANFLIESLPKRHPDLIRVHVGGEYPATAMGREYMRAWFHVARVTGIHVYSYTKNVETFLEVRHEQSDLDNFNMTISVGGLRDDLITKHNLKHARVIYHPSENPDGWIIDHTDINAVFTYSTDTNPSGSFSLLLHGTQPAGSEASAAIKRMKTENIKFSYPAKVGK